MALLPFAASQQQAGKSTPSAINPSRTVLPFAASQQQAKLNPQPTQKPISTPAPKLVAKAQPPSLLQNIWNSFTSFFAHAPEVPQLKSGITSPIPEKQMLPQARQAVQGSKVDQGAAFVGNMAGGFINTPVEAGKAVSSLGTHIQQKNSNPGQVAGDIASITMLPLMFLGGEEASTIPGFLKDVVNTTAKKAVVQIGKKIGTGAIIGSVGGFLGGVQQAQGTTNLKDYVNTIIHNTALGAGIGAGAEVGAVGTGAIAKNVAVPLAKGASNKLGAIFIKNANSNPKVVHMQLDPKIARSVVVGNEQLASSPVGRAITRESFVAEQNNQHVGITVDPHGAFNLPGGEKVDVSTVPVYDPTKATYGARDLGITHNPNLTEGDKKIATDFGNFVSQHYPDAVAQYNALPDTEGGRILSTDTAKELNGEYNKDRTKTMVVQQPASAFVKALYADKLKEPIQKNKDVVMFTAGGTGAGKTTAVSQVADVQAIKDKAQFVYDTNSANPERSIGQIQQALDAGRKVAIAYIHRDPVQAYENGVLPRAMKQGRTVSTNVHIKTHIGALASIIKIANHFKDEPNVAIGVIDNSGGIGEAHLIPIDKLRMIKYNEGELKQQLHETLNKSFENNKISQSVYNASKDTSGEKHNSTVQGNGEHNVSGNSKESQQERGANSLENTEQSPSGKSKSNTGSTTATNKRTNTTGTEASVKKVLTGNQVKGIRDIITAKLEHIRQTSASEEEYGKGIDSLVTDIEARAGGDKQVLSALRTELNQEMYGLVGKSGDYKADYKNLQELKAGDSPMGNLLTTIDNHIGALDHKLLTTPDKTYEQPAFVKGRIGKQTGAVGAQEPVGQGKPRESSAYKRLVAHLEDKNPEELAKMEEQEVKYHRMNIADQAEKGLDIVEKNPQQAYRIAKGYEAPPQGVTQHAVTMALADRAMAEKNYSLAADVHKSGSLHLTRAGQEIVMERGRYSDTSPHAFIRQLMQTRLTRLGNITEGIKTGEAEIKGSVTSAKARAIATIDKAAEKLAKEVKRQQVKIQSAQSLLDQLTCK